MKLNKEEIKREFEDWFYKKWKVHGNDHPRMDEIADYFINIMEAREREVVEKFESATELKHDTSTRKSTPGKKYIFSIDDIIKILTSTNSKE